MDSHIAADYKYKLPHQGRVNVSCLVSTQGGLAASIGSDHKLTTHSRVGLTLECGLAAGVIVKFRYELLKKQGFFNFKKKIGSLDLDKK